MKNVTQTLITELPLERSRIRVDLDLQHRQKGLLWYDTYAVKVRATFRARNPDTVPRRMAAHLMFASEQGQFDNFVFRRKK